jgi:hypothetical protein
MVSEYINMDEVVAILNPKVRSKPLQLHKSCIAAPEDYLTQVWRGAADKTKYQP